MANDQATAAHAWLDFNIVAAIVAGVQPLGLESIELPPFAAQLPSSLVGQRTILGYRYGVQATVT